MIYAVIDTNVLVSALITHNSLSATAKIVSLLLDGEFTPLYENSIIEEYQEVLHRAKFNLLPGVADALISYIKEYGIETSRTVDSSFLVTGNFKHYPQTPKVISPADFLRVIMNSKGK